MEYKIGLIGCGTVGQGFMEILEKKGEYLKEKLGFEARVVAISDKLKGSLLIPEGIDLTKILEVLGEGKNIDEYLEGSNPAAGMDPLGWGARHKLHQKGPSIRDSCGDFQQGTRSPPLYRTQRARPGE